jgi:flavodoxin
MKSLIVCKSIHHGNTRKVADVMSEVLKARVVEPSSVKPEDLSGYDLIGFGSGIYAHKHHKELLELADSLPQEKGKKVFIFSTSGSPPEKMGKHGPLRDALEKKGYSIVDEFSSRGFTTWAFFRLWGGSNKGRPNRDDLERARKFAIGLKGK